MMKQNLIRGKMLLLPLLQFSSGGEWPCKVPVVAKVTVQGAFLFHFFIFLGWECLFLFYFNQKLIYIFSGVV